MRDNWKWVEVKPQVHQVHRSEDESDYCFYCRRSFGRIWVMPQVTHHVLWMALCQPSIGTNAFI